MANEVYTIGVIVHPACGERLAALASRMPVWVADTAANRATAEAIWGSSGRKGSGTETGDITTFQIESGATPSQWAADILSMIDLHHGPYSHEPPYGAIEIVGSGPTADLRAALAEYDLGVTEERADGFLASRAPVA